MAEIIAIRLPWPPAVNNLYANGARGRYRTSRYDAWIADASAALRRQHPEALVGHFKVDLVFDRPDERRRDLDGLAKAPLDLLVKHQVVLDDSLAREIRLRWSGMPGRKPGGVLILLEAA